MAVTDEDEEPTPEVEEPEVDETEPEVDVETDEETPAESTEQPELTDGTSSLNAITYITLLASAFAMLLL